MALETLAENGNGLLQFLRDNGYSDRIISMTSSEIKRILRDAADNGWSNYRDVYHSYDSREYSADLLRQKRHCLRMLYRYTELGEFPDRCKHSSIYEKDWYVELPGVFKELVEFYKQHEKERGKKETTIYHESLNTLSFFRFIHERGIEKLEDITEKDVLAFFLSADGTIVRGCSYKKNISAVFKAGIYWNEDACRRILLMLPALRENRKIIQYLTEEETAAITAILRSADSSLSLRDRAIGWLFLCTGLRACDIANLLLEAIDWKNEKIHIIQQKTEVPLELPLLPVVGNAIYDYLAGERPQIDDIHVFLSEDMPYRPLRNGSMGNITARIFSAAGIRMNQGDRRGTHIFRHRAASRMLENGVPQPIISRTFGHTAPDSLEPYLMADFKHLKACSLSIEAYPVSEEVLPL